MDEKILASVTQLRHALHQNPELSNHEAWTREHLMSFLKANTKLEIVNKGLWFYAVYHAGADKRNVAFRADIDAIVMPEPSELFPYASKNAGISHKCGHDGHAAVLAALALDVDRNGADKNVFFLFQHAEETGDGAAECAVFIKENNIDEIFAFHNFSGPELHSVSVLDGTMFCASRGMIIHMEGLPAHASQPELGKNPSLAIANVISAIPGLIAPDKNKGMVLCTVVQVDIGEKAFGVSASKGDLLLTIRALYESELDRLQANLESIARAQAAEHGLEVEFAYQDCFPETANHPESNDKIRQAADNLGLKIIEMPEAFRGSEDFGHYLKQTKGAIFLVGNGTDYPRLHCYEYDFPDVIIPTAFKMFRELVNSK